MSDSYNSIVEALFAHAAETPEKLCLADDTHSVTYGEYADLISRQASVFRDLGVSAGDQTIDFLATEMALQIIGAIFVPVEHNCGMDKMLSFKERTGSRFIVCSRRKEKAPEADYSVAEISKMAEDAEPYEVSAFPEKESVGEILFSTGTTGAEKGIVLTHGNDVALAENVIFGVEMEPDNVEMILSPFNHSHGLRRYYGNMYNGSTVIIVSTVINIEKIFDYMEKYQVNSMDLVPSALSLLLKLSKDKLGDFSKQLRYIQLGSAPLMKDDKAKLISLLPDTRLYNIYGSTESGVSCIYDFNRPDEKAGCIGKPARNAEIFMLDENRNVIESSAETPGFLACRGTINMVGYLDDPEETKAAMDDGAVITKDMAYFDEDGDIILLGRSGDVINVGGKKVAPVEIENTASLMPGIADCGCIPVEDEIRGNVPKLFVQMEKDADFDAVAIRHYLTEHLEPYKVPVYIESIKKIPRTYKGSIQRNKLK